MGGKRKDGIKTLADLQGRCVPDELTGCLRWAFHKRGGSPRVWLPDFNRVASLTQAMHFLMYGRMPDRGVRLVPTCGHSDCANPHHRRLGTPGELMAAVLPVARPISRGARGRLSKLYTPDLAEEIRESNAPSSVWAARTGLSATLICRIKRGEAWNGPAQGASVFNWRPGA